MHAATIPHEPAPRRTRTVHGRSEAEPECAESARKMGFESAGISAAQFSEGPPSQLLEFTLIWLQRLPYAAGEGEPETDIYVLCLGRPDGLGHRQEERPPAKNRVELRTDAEFFGGFTSHGREGMLGRFDMASGSLGCSSLSVILMMRGRRGGLGALDGGLL